MTPRHRLIPLAAFLLFALAALLAVAAQGQAQGPTGAPVLPATPYAYNDPLPPHFLAGPIADEDNTPASNPITDAGATLGRVLFYDKRLSVNNEVSCATCHIQALGFSDPNPQSGGVAPPQVTRRNSMGVANARYYDHGAFFWDERAATLEDQVLMPIQDPVEMGSDLSQLVAELNATPYYAPLTQAAFGSPTLTEERMSLAMAQFVRSIVSYRSRYDEGVATNFANFTMQERMGLNLFNGTARCAQCHITHAQIADEPRNIGLDATSTTDLGLFETTGNPADIGKFKVPSLRNIELSGPYMHDGRFDTLEEVVLFYDQQVQPHPQLDPILKDANGQPLRLNLTAGQRAALVAFMKTLTDPALNSDVRFSDPFVGGNTLYLPLIIRR